MKKLFPYLFVLFVACTACSSDDTAIPSYTKITKEEKELLLGDWRLSHYSNTEGEQIDLTREGLFVRYTFTTDRKVIIANESKKPIGSASNSYYLTENGTMEYTFAYVKSWDETVAKKERLHFESVYDGNPNLQFDLEVTQNKLILTHYAGEILVFEKIQKGVTYPKISEESKKLLLGTWRLREMGDFTGRRRVLTDEEEVLYEFSYYDKLFVTNHSVSKDGTFDIFIQSRVSDYGYKYDFKWEEQEIVVIDGLGGYLMGVDQDALSLVVSDGARLRFERIR
ncbi:hypothetical protein [Myroides odoratus]|uniref:Lipocalin-like domain-containing protein n=1 Tax=Myroides odoratus TaxID=256 RepID=A0A9Q6Z9Z0_MYROD|nr:hypothetical protein [Myroides odoratus]EHQ42214.1 hypothetical protein Myrod_1381 [Myroides odoratus DSM 2801]EKB09292.1 hypothetical protein HMPREF9716_00112 [Myroides odoratus CIP 103059]QQT99594.1 hypothetical protein I6I88_15635 [Myroides odoratus]WQD58199.1 hypothetical protein U0010_03320 [Myroides odoratus]STZ29474.1 Uncharacterised protein [Myroides odoratus]